MQDRRAGLHVATAASPMNPSARAAAGPQCAGVARKMICNAVPAEKDGVLDSDGYRLVIGPLVSPDNDLRSRCLNVCISSGVLGTQILTIPCLWR